MPIAANGKASASVEREEAPRPWEAQPVERPRARGEVIFRRFKRGAVRDAPIKPVRTTAETAWEGSELRREETERARGLVI